MKTRIIKLITTAYCLLFTAYCYSQDWQWAVSCGKTTGDETGRIALDNSNNIYLAGNNPNNGGTYGTSSIAGPYAFSKLDASGNFIWVKGITYTGYLCSNITYNLHVASNKNISGAIYFGTICGNVNIDTVNLVSGSERLFLARFDDNGSCLWAKLMGGYGNETPNAISVDNNGNSYILANVSSNAVFGLVNVQNSSAGVCLAKYDINGNCKWAKYLSGSTNSLFGITVNSIGEVMLAGPTVSSNFVFDGETLYPTHSTGGNLLLAKYDTNGNKIWSKLKGGTTQILPKVRITYDNIGNYYVTGTQGTDTLFFGRDTLYNTNPDVRETFIVKYDANDSVIWAKNSFSSKGYTTPYDITSGNDGKIYITGSLGNAIGYGSTVIVGSQTMTQVSYGGDSPSDMYLAGFDSIGECIGLDNTGRATGVSVVADNSGNSYVVGQFSLGATLGSVSFGTYNLSTAGGQDIFIAKHSPFTVNVEKVKENSNMQLMIYANPNEGKCNITVPEEFNNEKNLTLQIFDNSGKVIQKAKIDMTEDKIKLDIRSEAKGIYNVVLTNGKKNYGGKIVFE